MARSGNNPQEQQRRTIAHAEAAAEPPPNVPHVGPPGRRGAVRIFSALTVACGLVVASSPLFVRYAGDFGQWSAVLAGAAVALLALARSTGLHRLRLLSYANVALGVWILVTSFWLEGSGGARAITGVFGLLIAGCALMSAAHGERDSIGSSSG